MSIWHLRCRRAGSYSFEVGGTLDAAGVRREPRRVVVSPEGSWRLTSGPGERDAPAFPELILAPALVDAHVHLHPGIDLREYVRFGICRIRDLGSRTEDRPAAVGCEHPTPEVLRGGPMLDRPGRRRLLIAAQWQRAEDLPGLLDAAVTDGTSWVKLYEGFPPELFGPTVELAHERGLRVAVHPAPGDYRAALDARADELEHLACLIPTGERGTHAALARWARWSPAEDWPKIPAGTAICPTLLVPTVLVEQARLGWAFEGHDRAMTDFWRTAAIARRRWTAAQLRIGERAVAAMRIAVGELDRAGVRWVIGSDTPNPGLRAGQSLWQEMNELVSAGLDGRRVFRASTIAGSVANAGTHPLVLLSADTCEGGPFPVTPPAAVLLRGCLYIPEGAQS